MYEFKLSGKSKINVWWKESIQLDKIFQKFVWLFKNKKYLKYINDKNDLWSMFSNFYFLLVNDWLDFRE